MVLSHYLGIPPASVVFQYSQFGKPNLGRSTHIADIRFNIAHSHQMLLIGVTLGRDLGVDLEYRELTGSLGSLASLTLNDKEMSTFLKLDDSPRKEFLLQAWTRKEAFAKASGTGLRDPDFSHQVEHRENKWRYQDFGSVPLYAAALVVATTDNRPLLLREITINLLEISHGMRYPDDVRGLQSRANVQNREWSA